MAASTAKLDGLTQNEAHFTTFMEEVKAIEERDAVLTPKQQIDRLLRPGSTYFNLNPFEVIQVPPDMGIDDIKKKYRRLSILVHPDKNINDRDRAQKAFEVLTNAMKIVEDEEKRTSMLAIIQEAKEKNEFLLEEKRKKRKKEGQSTEIEEDDPEKFKETLYKTTVKLFADYEIRRRELAERDAVLRKREREEEIVQEEKVKKQKEWEKEWEKSRDDRVESWRDFKQGGKKKKKIKNRMAFKPPKPKLEQR
ncbi:dnaJ homolog subfamily C member 8-like isoform X2 [Asterias rubens]|uniref:dnaJ homolog subfamily C member 8-like n=1 Tax=Asterias amurensis TaxID=7602 RepID=UPI001454F11D|nr:dnaJ homolog subfamily C member 8-like isoform X2 [Asterias rubens]